MHGQRDPPFPIHLGGDTHLERSPRRPTRTPTEPVPYSVYAIRGRIRVTRFPFYIIFCNFVLLSPCFILYLSNVVNVTNTLLLFVLLLFLLLFSCFFFFVPINIYYCYETHCVESCGLFRMRFPTCFFFYSKLVS